MGNYLLIFNIWLHLPPPPPTLVILSPAPWTDTSAWSRKSFNSSSLSSPWSWPPSRLLSQPTSLCQSSTPTDSSALPAPGSDSSSPVFTTSPWTLDSVKLSARLPDTDTSPSTTSTTLSTSVRSE